MFLIAYIGLNRVFLLLQKSLFIQILNFLLNIGLFISETRLKLIFYERFSYICDFCQQRYQETGTRRLRAHRLAANTKFER